MIKPGLLSFTRRAALAAGSVLLLAIAGCKGNPAPTQSSSPQPVGPPIMHASAAQTDPLESDPVNNLVWRAAHWSTLVASINDPRTVTNTWVASSYSPTTLYAAFICGEPAVASAPVAGSVAAAHVWDRESVELWLDTSGPDKQNGTEVFRIVAAPDGTTYTCWVRSSKPPEPNADGTPNYDLPISRVPDYRVPGLKVSAARATYNGQPVWTIVMAVPLKSLPQPLKTIGLAGKRFHLNMLRNDWINANDGRRELVQTDFAPTYKGAAHVTPYRMGELVFEPAPILTLRIDPSSHIDAR